MAPMAGGQSHSAEVRWRRTKRLALVTLVLWIIFGFAVHGFVRILDTVSFAGFPLGFYMAAQGSLIAFVALVFWFCHRQEAIDRNAGMAEDEERTVADT